MNNSEIKEEENNKKQVRGLYLKINVSENSIGNYDKSHIEFTQEAIITKKTLLIVNKHNKILEIKSQGKFDKKDGENMLFQIRESKNKKCFQLEKELCNDMVLSEDNIEGLNYNLWYAINNDNVNDDYYLSENDIIRFGNIKLVLRKININDFKENSNSNILKYNIKEINSKILKDNNIKKIKFEQIFDNNDFIPINENKIKICNICNSSIEDEDNPLINLCDCNNFNHYICIKEDLKKKMLISKNKKKTAINYYLSFHCDNCQKSLPLSIKIKNTNISYKFFDIEEIEKPKEEENYLIFESLDYLDRYLVYQKSIHLVKLQGEGNIIKIKIGRDGSKNDNDVKLVTDSVSRDHAIIEYNKEEGNLLLKNISKKNDSLVLIKNTLIINKNKINLQIGKVSVEANLIEKSEFKDDIIDKIQSKEEYEEEIRKQIESSNINNDWANAEEEDIKTDKFFLYSGKE